MPYSSNDPRNYLALARQSGKATEATTGFKFLKYLSGGIQPSFETESIYEGGDGQDVGLVYKKNVSVGGEFDAFARPDTFAFLAAWVMGSGVTPPSTAGIASHIYTPNATIPHLTCEQAFGGGNTIDRAVDTLLTGFKIEAEAGMPWKITVPLLGAGTYYHRNGSASALSPTLESGDPAMYQGGAYLITGATSLDVRSWTYDFQRSVDGDLYTNALNRRDVTPLTRGLTLGMQVIMQDENLYRTILYNGGTQVDVPLASGSFHAERGLTASQLLAVDVPNLKWTDVQVNRLEPDGQTVVLDVSAQAVKQGTGITQLRANITGQPTSYLIA